MSREAPRAILITKHFAGKIIFSRMIKLKEKIKFEKAKTLLYRT